ncbi:MAG: hypothetical protein R3302_01135 [Sulfurimonadaceae bacterium]|nr:hypothetical protein [Sulfurimonadaceae bacterium]
MKIESHSVAMRAEHALSISKSTVFETELQTLEVEKEADRLTLLEEQRQLMARLQYELLNRLLRIIGGCRCKEPEPVGMPQRLDEPTVETVRITERRFEHQSFSVAMQGCIKTDSQEIAIDINLSMSHTYVSQRQISEAVFYDPLVINFDGEIPQLDETTFSFDIDNDGERDQISKLKEGNGFLALDENFNGVIDAGCELFGTKTGHGFVELSMHDKDGNDWIDENDDVFDKLRIWTHEDDGKRLLGLGEAGIGAIYLGSAYTPMDYKNAENEALGRLRSTGLFLHENGKSGVIGEIDFAKPETSGKNDGLSTALASL